MGKIKTWTQCAFTREVDGGYKRTTAWIDTKGAKQGHLVELKSLDGEFWKVDYVGNTVDKLPPFTFENNI
jgi:hypothetical protein